MSNFPHWSKIFNCDLRSVSSVQQMEGAEGSASVWGPTCDGLDCVVARMRLPPLAVGSWMIFRDMGAYTLPVASAFNGFPVPKVRAVVERRLWAVLKELLPLTEDHFVFTEPVAAANGNGIAPHTPPPSPIPAAPQHRAVFVECALK